MAACTSTVLKTNGDIGTVLGRINVSTSIPFMVNTFFSCSTPWVWKFYRNNTDLVPTFHLKGPLIVQHMAINRRQA